MTHDCFVRLGLNEDARVVPPSRRPADPIAAGLTMSENPATGAPIAGVRLDDGPSYERAVERACAVQRAWRSCPAPRRGEIVRRIGLAFRDHREDLGALVSLEMGKILPEGVGEVQECIDIADFAVGLSRQCYGLTMPSERADHRMMEQWHPLGTVGVITAFNFPIAVWAWNAMLASVCGDAVLWKPSLLTPLVAIATTRIVRRVMREQDLFRPDGCDPQDLFTLVIGTDEQVGRPMVDDRRLPLISATGSCRMGREVGQRVAARLGRSLLELGGNNAIVVMPDCDRDLVVRAVLFGAVGTAGQRCTTTRRLICVGGVERELLPRLVEAYRAVRIGDPLDPGALMGPLISAGAVKQMRSALERAAAQGCEVLAGGIPGIDRFAGRAGHFVEPTLVRVPAGQVPSITREETFAPILYVFSAGSFQEAMALHNDVPQGLSSAVFTGSVGTAERFLSPEGSDCGIANVNLGTSGAEIGGAFGGEKETGGGRESGSDSWKAYMRRQTCTINYGTELPLAQGITFQ
ncbi:MAG TPA: aldehyde dehydrogenase family protein [Phycisphaerales bacterium]|nr:aldehyde dehydrogenase family protein [Phycisphaerales bacterium]